MRRLSGRELRRLTKRMGLNLKEMEGVEEVVIKLSDKEIVIKNPTVSIVEIKGGGRIYQITGKEEERSIIEETVPEEIEISEEDIQLVVAQTGVSPEEAKKALMESGGDLAKAIMLLSSR